MDPPQRIVCSECGNVFYENPLPGVAVVIRNVKGHVLLCKRKKGKFRAGFWCLPCGFIEKDETYLATAYREVYEETGLTICVESIINVFTNFFIDSRPTLVIALLAKYVAGEILPGDDVDMSEWIDAKTMLTDKMAFAADVSIISDYVNGVLEKRGCIKLLNQKSRFHMTSEDIFGF